MRNILSDETLNALVFMKHVLRNKDEIHFFDDFLELLLVKVEVEFLVGLITIRFCICPQIN